MQMADGGWLAMPATQRGHDRDSRVRRLCRLLGVGLMAVDAACDQVEGLADPGVYRSRPDQRRRTHFGSEHARRKGDPLLGGSTRQPVMSAYRQQALDCAPLLQAGPGRPRDFPAVAPKAGTIMPRTYTAGSNERRGVYPLTNAGEARYSIGLTS
jgi:hypothetical protein